MTPPSTIAYHRITAKLGKGGMGSVIPQRVLRIRSDGLEARPRALGVNLLFYEDCSLVVLRVIKPVHNILDPEIIRSDRVATRTIFQQDALPDARHELRFVIRMVSRLIYDPEAVHVFPCDPLVKLQQGRR